MFFERHRRCQADRGDAAAGDGEITGDTGIAGAVVQNSAADQDVVHAPVIPDCRASGKSAIHSHGRRDYGFRAPRYARPRNDGSRLHAQRERRSGRARAGGGFDVGVPGDGDGAAGAGHRDQLLARAAGEIAIAALAATGLAQRVQAARAGGAGRAGGTDRPGLAFDALRPLRPGIALRPGGPCGPSKQPASANAATTATIANDARMKNSLKAVSLNENVSPPHHEVQSAGALR